MVAPRTRVFWLLGFMAALHLLAFIAMARGGETLARGVAVVSVVPLALGGLYLLSHLVRPLTWLDYLVLLYVLWSLASALSFLQEGNPSDPGAYIYGLYYFVLPIACYFATKSVPEEWHPDLLSGLVLLNGVAVAIGLSLHVTRPPFYNAYLTVLLTPRGATEEWQFFARLQSYLGSTSVGYLGAVSLVLLTLARPAVRRFLPVLAVLFIVGTGMSLQRASYIGLGLSLIYLLFFSDARLVVRGTVVVMLVAGVIYLALRFQETGDPLTTKLLDRATADMAEGVASFSHERGYSPALRTIRQFPLGVGLGGTASAAANGGVRVREVSDANFMRIASDLGYPGLLLFLLILATATWGALRSRHREAWLTVLVIHSGIMLSTNVFDSFYISHSFWLMLAVIDRDRLPATRTIRGVSGATASWPLPTTAELPVRRIGWHNP